MRAAAFIVLLCTAATAGAEPQQVRVGVHLRNIDAIDLATNAYSLQFVLWMRWTGDRDPTGSFRFTNVIDAWALTMQPAFDEPQVLEDGSKYQRFTVEGRFFHKFWLGTFPLDWQKVTLELEDQRHDADSLVFIADEGSAIEPALEIPGWVIGEPINESKIWSYPSGFGGGGEAKFSRYRYGAILKRPASLFFLKMLPPIALVLLCCYFVFFVRPAHVDARVGTAITALMTVVFLQLAFTDDLPYLGISVLIDQIFNFSYLMMTLILLECVFVIRAHDEATRLEAQGHPVLQPRIDALHARVARLDHFAQRAFPAIYLLGCLLITLIARGTALFGLPF